MNLLENDLGGMELSAQILLCLLPLLHPGSLDPHLPNLPLPKRWQESRMRVSYVSVCVCVCVRVCVCVYLYLSISIYKKAR